MPMIDRLVADVIGKSLARVSPFSEHLLHEDIATFLELEGFDSVNAVEVPYDTAGDVINAMASSRIQAREKGLVLIHGNSIVEGSSYGFYASIFGRNMILRPYPDRGGLEIFPFHEDIYLSQDFGTDTVDASKKPDDNPYIRLDAYSGREDKKLHNFLVFHLSKNPAFVYVPRKTY